jgi:hypothetical protein
VAIGAGATIAGKPSEWSALTTASLASACGLVLLTAAGMAQARRMTIARRRANAAPHDEQATSAVRRGATMAAVLRGAMAVVTLAVVVLVAHELAG